VTGGAGFIGSRFVLHRLGDPQVVRLVVIDSLSYAGSRERLDGVRNDPRLEFVHGDVRDGRLVAGLIAEEDLRLVVHFAAETHVDRSLHDPLSFVDTNIGGTAALLEAARQGWRSPQGCLFHHVSTDEIYGPVPEARPAAGDGTPFDPRSPYAASKAGAEHLVRAWGASFGLPVSISQAVNCYGPAQYPEKLVPTVLLSALLGLPIPVYGDGLQVRDWLHADDFVAGLALALEAAEPGRCWRFAGESPVANRNLVAALCESVDALFRIRPELARTFPDAPGAAGRPSDGLIRQVADRPAHDRRYALDDRATRAALGWAPRTALGPGLTDTVAWFADHEAWWRPLADGPWREWRRRHYRESGNP
jgi:dTDP-glucose 4,6-dehydratase